jgi:hypothetical protein
VVFRKLKEFHVLNFTEFWTKYWYQYNIVKDMGMGMGICMGIDMAWAWAFAWALTWHGHGYLNNMLIFVHNTSIYSCTVYILYMDKFMYIPFRVYAHVFILHLFILFKKGHSYYHTYNNHRHYQR